ncbi:MAG: 2,3,4,5-tetrahydropyridine-2,6-dicarboxylate N-succinyltransferase [Gammaproteobacteria bacterium]|nr:2,3,4,5-tetrahydropyridine-2,6-dicarboxylate N-succinyltransferase [Gammaproteobacteria bacterium]
MECFAFGLGVGHQNSDDQWLDVYYPKALCRPDPAVVKIIAEVFGWDGANLTRQITADDLDDFLEALEDSDDGDAEGLLRALTPLAGSEQPLVICALATDEKPSSVPEVYLKLSMISMRKIQPHGTNLEGMFGLLPNVAWTSQGPIDVKELAHAQTRARAYGEVLTVHSVDKFPRMSDYVVPQGVRIGDASRIRLGAHLGEGTTVMHEGFINFNAGTLGVSMVEGRISAGVVVGDGSDLGGGCSTMGTLSGGGGANAGLGIPLGDRCTIESGLYLTSGSKVKLLDKDGQSVGVVKARDLASKDDLLFRRNSVTGEIECLANKSAVALNDELHSNN